MTANGGAQREENRSETERGGLDFPSAQCTDKASAVRQHLRTAAFDPRNLLIRIAAERVFLLVDSTIHSLQAPPPALGLARHVEMTATCFTVFCCFSSSISPCCLYLLVWLKEKLCMFHFSSFFANAPNTSASTRTLRSHLPVCIGPFGVTRSHHRCVLTEKPPWQLQSRARKEKKQV